MTEAADRTPEDRTGYRRTSVALAAAVVAAITIPLVSLGRHAGLWGPLPAMMIAFGVTLLGVIVALILGLTGLMARRGRAWRAYPVRGSWYAFIIAVVVLIPVGQFMLAVRYHPPIHDITTDTADPPAFNALVIVRAGSPNGAVYNPGAAPAQKQAYPDIAPLTLAVPADQAFSRALEAAKAMGWTIVASDAGDGRIEASAETFWSGFIDDVVVRVKPVDEGHARVDVRSASRVGISDLGVNADRIRAYLAKLT